MLCKCALQIQVSHFGIFWNFFPNIFDPQLVEPTDAKPSDLEGHLNIEFLKFTKWINTIWPGDGVNISESQERVG